MTDLSPQKWLVERCSSDHFYHCNKPFWQLYQNYEVWEVNPDRLIKTLPKRELKHIALLKILLRIEKDTMEVFLK